MEVKHLGHTDFDVLMECFLVSFQGYFVKMPTDYNYYKQRWKAAKVSFELSFGMFDKGKLVGFIINAIDERQGEYIAFNTGTGVVHEYRGKKIVKSIYEYAIPELKKGGITKCALEVITENHKAIKAYQGVGFNICKHLKCYNGTISLKENNPQIIDTTYKKMNWDTLPNQELYSWDNQNKCLENGDYNYYKVLNDKEEAVAFFVINLENDYVAQLDVLEESEINWELLFSAIKSVSPTIKINNIDDRLVEKLKAVESVGLQNSINQYEMEMRLK